VPKLCIEIYDAVKAGDINRARLLQETLTPLARAVTRTYGIGGLKTAMEMAGFIGGSVRAPLQRPSEPAVAELAQMLKQATDAADNTPQSALPVQAPVLAGT
jgi:dihydrodipicolinate synthase/N-acetylneuraminate lyase